MVLLVFTNEAPYSGSRLNCVSIALFRQTTYGAVVGLFLCCWWVVLPCGSVIVQCSLPTVAIAPVLSIVAHALGVICCHG